MDNLKSFETERKAPPRIAVAGVSGYAGGELVRLLFAHPNLSAAAPLLLGRAGDGEVQLTTSLEDLHPQLLSSRWRGKNVVYQFSWDRVERFGTEILFLATPHEQSREWVPEAIARGIRVIDLSGAWRLKVQKNREVYKFHDANALLAATLQDEAVYGCPELHRNEIENARLVANPGCYATSIILAIAPLLQAGVVDLTAGIVCDSKSGVSGAGKAATAKTHFMYAADNMSAYSVFGHRHTGELLEQLNLSADEIQFTPHLLPIPRGILSTIYLKLKYISDVETITRVVSSFYQTSPMVRVRSSNQLPQIQQVVRTSYCDVGLVLAPDGKRVVLVSCLDNLLKGAAGQAVQNMNLMCGWKEEEGLL